MNVKYEQKLLYEHYSFRTMASWGQMMSLLQFLVSTVLIHNSTITVYDSLQSKVCFEWAQKNCSDRIQQCQQLITSREIANIPE